MALSFLWSYIFCFIMSFLFVQKQYNVIPVAKTSKLPKQHEYPRDFQFALLVGCYANEDFLSVRA